MTNMNNRMIALLLLLLTSTSTQADADTPTASALRWDTLSAQEQQALAPMRDRWDQLSAERQQALRKGAVRWSSMSPEQRAEAKQRWQRWQKLSPQQRDTIQKRFQRFKQLPPEEQERIQQRQRWFHSLPPDERRVLRERWEKAAPAERHAAPATTGADLVRLTAPDKKKLTAKTPGTPSLFPLKAAFLGVLAVQHHIYFVRDSNGRGLYPPCRAPCPPDIYLR
jgi:hypothetical protein